MKSRTIKQICKSEKVDAGGFIIDQPLPHSKVDYINPFILLHHGVNFLFGNQIPQELGVGPHPHRGFSPVTIVFKGNIHHRDSRGNSQIIDEGGVQWMNAGMGIIHSERPSKALAAKGGILEIIQFWVNTPRTMKMKEPLYQPLFKSQIPVILSKDGIFSCQLIAGHLDGKEGLIITESELLVLRLDFDANGKIQIEIPSHYNALLYVLDGQLEINGQKINPKEMAQFNLDGNKLDIISIAKGKAVILAGVPIEEPVSKYGPYVMNTQTEILEAMRDYKMGKMGILIEDFE